MAVSKNIMDKVVKIKQTVSLTNIPRYDDIMDSLLVLAAQCPRLYPNIACLLTML